jgi:protein-export SecD/SecF family membrane protein
MFKVRLAAIALLVLGAAIGFFLFSSERPGAAFPFRFGLDLAGGTHLVYQADTSGVAPGEVDDAMESLRDVIERRVNVFGVSEPLVQVETASAFAVESGKRLVVELPGVTDVDAAIAAIGQTPLLEFRLAQVQEGTTTVEFVPTGLTGALLARASLEFSQGPAGGIANTPVVALRFNDEGAKLFEEITRENVGNTLAIFLDGAPISLPVIQEAISGGTATITGQFSPEEARELVRNLNFGALPVPISLLETSTIGPTLGAESLDDGVVAGVFGSLIVMVFMVLWYRVPGLVASLALFLYVLLMLAIFKLIPVTLTAAGIAGFILSIGMAVDANILIFERLKEELRAGKQLRDAIREGFARAWLSIRDSNASSLITGVILFWFGTSLVKGFALTFILGVLVSMLSAITVTRTFLLAISKEKTGPFGKALFKSGFHL